MMLIVYFGSFLELQHECICCRFLVGNLVANPELALHESNWPVMLESFEILCSVHPKISMPSIAGDTSFLLVGFQVLPSDPFGCLKWPFLGLSDLNLGYQKVTWKKLVDLLFYMLVNLPSRNVPPPDIAGLIRAKPNDWFPLTSICLRGMFILYHPKGLGLLDPPMEGFEPI